MRIDHDHGVRVLAKRLALEFVADDVAHQGRLAHPGASDVEVMTALEVVGEPDRLRIELGGQPDLGPARQFADRRRQRARAGARDKWRLVGRPGGMPEGRDLAHAEYAAAAEQARRARVERRSGLSEPLQAARFELRAGGMVVVAVGRGEPVQQLPGSVLARAGGQDGDQLEFRFERAARGLFLDQLRIERAVA